MMSENGEPWKQSSAPPQQTLDNAKVNVQANTYTVQPQQPQSTTSTSTSTPTQSPFLPSMPQTTNMNYQALYGTPAPNVNVKELGDAEYRSLWGTRGDGYDLNNVQAYSQASGRSMGDIIMNEPGFEYLQSGLKNWLSIPENYNMVHQQGAGQIHGDSSWLQQTLGKLAPIGAAVGSASLGPVAGTLIGSGMSAFDGGISNVMDNLAVNLLSSYGSDYLNKQGLYGNSTQANRFSTTPKIDTSEIPSTYQDYLNTQSSVNPFAESINVPTANELTSQSAGIESPFSQSGGMNNLSLPSSGQNLSLKDPNLVANSITNSQAARDQVVKYATANKDQSALDLIQAGNWVGALQRLISTPQGAALTAGLIGKVFNNESAPEMQAIDAGGLNMTQEYLNRLKPEYYAMSQEEKDYIYKNAMEKINANLAQRGVTRGAVSMKAASDIIQAIEMQDLQQQRQFASNAFYSFVDYLNGKEQQAYTNYINATNQFNESRAAFNQNIAGLIELSSGKKTGSSYKTVLTPNKDGGYTVSVS